MCLLNCMLEVNGKKYFSGSNEKPKSCKRMAWWRKRRTDTQKHKVWQGKGGEVEKTGLMKCWHRWAGMAGWEEEVQKPSRERPRERKREGKKTDWAGQAVGGKVHNEIFYWVCHFYVGSRLHVSLFSLGLNLLFTLEDTLTVGLGS